jgi:hypothetical protein
LGEAEGGKKRGKAAADKKATLLYLDPGVAKDLKLAAVERETSASALANEAISIWLDHRGFLTRREEK